MSVAQEYVGVGDLGGGGCCIAAILLTISHSSVSVSGAVRNGGRETVAPTLNGGESDPNRPVSTCGAELDMCHGPFDVVGKANIIAAASGIVNHVSGPVFHGQQARCPHQLDMVEFRRESRSNAHSHLCRSRCPQVVSRWGVIVETPNMYFRAHRSPRFVEGIVGGSSQTEAESLHRGGRFFTAEAK
jgi:hypothetical protein